MSDIKELTSEMVHGMRIDVLPRKGRTVSGYGDAMPTPYMLYVGGYWYRVKVVNYANSGSAYVTIKGQRHYLSSDVEHAIERKHEQCERFKRLDVEYNTDKDSPLHHNNRCQFH